MPKSLYPPFGVPVLGTVATVASGNLTLTEPAGAVAGDLLVCVISFRDAAAFTVPGDWTIGPAQQTGNADVGLTTSISGLLMMYCIRGASAPTLTFNRTGGNAARGRIMLYPASAQAFAANPLAGSGVVQLGAGSTSISLPGITPSAVGPVLLVAAVAAARDTTISGVQATLPSGVSGSTDTTSSPSPEKWLERYDAGHSTGAGGGLAHYDAVQLTPGATGNILATAGSSARHTMGVMAFKLAGEDNAVEQVQRTGAYAVMTPGEDNVALSRTGAYAVMIPTAAGVAVGQYRMSALIGHSPNAESVAIQKFRVSMVIDPDAPPPPAKSQRINWM